jgi:hypothetical protein
MIGLFILLDPANDSLCYEAAIDVSELITVEDVMDYVNLGPNGSLIYCIEYLEKRLDWFLEKLRQFNNYYLLFDCPGQVHNLICCKLIYVICFNCDVNLGRNIYPP